MQKVYNSSRCNYTIAQTDDEDELHEHKDESESLSPRSPRKSVPGIAEERESP